MSDAGVYRPRYWVSCSAALDLLGASGGQIVRAADGMAESLLEYNVLIYTNRDVEVDCVAGIGSVQSGSSGHYYPVVVKGAQTGACLANSDYPPTGMDVGYWDFELPSGPHAQYVDPDNPLGLNGFTHSFTESECNSYVLDQDDKWKQVTLADVF